MNMEETTEEPIVMDGEIEIWALDPYASEAIHRKFSFNDIDMIHIEHWGIRVVLCEAENGQETFLLWPWQQILHVRHLTNSTEVTEQLRNRDIGKYAQGAIDVIEQIANGAKHTPGAHVHDDGVGPKVSHGFETPCGHGAAVQSVQSDVWTCLECAAQWKDNQWQVEG
jgi:hypothetical protein